MQAVSTATTCDVCIQLIQAGYEPRNLNQAMSLVTATTARYFTRALQRGGDEFFQ